jgi:RND family efflux transporter MFP subunit
MTIRTARAPRTAIALCLSACTAWSVMAAELVLTPQRMTETRAVFGRVETRDVVAARPRIGGTVIRLVVTEGDMVSAGQSLATVADDKLALQMAAADARIRALAAEQANTQTELDRARTLLERGSGTQQRVDQLRTQLSVLVSQIAAAQADKSVIAQQSAEGDVVAPISGRVVKVGVTRGAVVMPGEQIALIAGGGFFLRLALPERHASQLKLGSAVPLTLDDGRSTTGRLVKVFPQIENGRVVADVEIDQIGDFFVGARVLAQVPIGERLVTVVPRAAISTRAGIDFVTLATPQGRRDVVVVPGQSFAKPGGDDVEILSGLRQGDRVVVP